jgi:tetratricopeptide (TPR) repeat protein
MKQSVLTGVLATAVGITCLMAQGQEGKPQQGQGQQGQVQQPLFPNTKSPGESQAVMALLQAQNNPDATIKAADELLTKYTDTYYKEIALMVEAQAYRQKGDLDKAIIYGERVLEVNPKNFQTTLMIGEILAQRTRENDLDKEEKLARAEKLLRGTIDTLSTAPKPNPQLTDAQWEDGKKMLLAEAHNGLGVVALDRKKYDEAATEFRTAMDTDPQEPTYGVRLASALQSQGKNDEAIALCDKILAMPELNPQVKMVTENIKKAAQSAKK